MNVLVNIPMYGWMYDNNADIFHRHSHRHTCINKIHIFIKNSQVAKVAGSRNSSHSSRSIAQSTNSGTLEKLYTALGKIRKKL